MDTRCAGGFLVVVHRLGQKTPLGAKPNPRTRQHVGRASRPTLRPGRISGSLLPIVVALAALVILPPVSAGFELGSTLPRPDQIRGGLVQPKKLALPPVGLGDDTRVVVFFYSASWCAPCKQIGAALRQTYTEFRERAPGLEMVTYAIDESPRARADYLREEAYPWPALGPSVIDRDPWLTEISGGTPQFQAFAVEANQLRAITVAGKAAAVMDAALSHLVSTVPRSQ